MEITINDNGWTDKHNGDEENHERHDQVSVAREFAPWHATKHVHIESIPNKEGVETMHCIPQAGKDIVRALGKPKELGRNALVGILLMLVTMLTIEGVGKYGRDSEWALRKLHALKGWKVDVEVALLDNSASAAGSSGVTRTMNGLRFQDSLSATANASSTLSSPIDEGNLNVLLQLMWDQGVIPDRLVCGSFVKRGISQFAGQGAGRPIFISNGERVFADVVDIYESDFGRIQLIASRRLNIKSDVICYQNNLMGLAFLRPPVARPTPNDGDFLSGAIVGELTFEYLNANGAGRLRRVQSA